MMFPKIKKSISDFFREESGLNTKKSILMMGLLSFALSARAPSVTAWEWSNKCIGWDSNREALALSITHSRPCDKNRRETYEFSLTLDDIERGGGIPEVPEGYVIANPLSAQEFELSLRDHISHTNSSNCCMNSNHFNDTDTIEDFPDLFYHKNELFVSSEDESMLVASHSHDIIPETVKPQAHASDHWSQDYTGNLCYCSGVTSHINNGDHIDWDCE